MSILPELSEDSLRRMRSAEMAAAEMVNHARVHLDRAARSSKSLGALESELGTSDKRFTLQEERDCHLDSARRCIRLATSGLFDVVAAKHWQNVFADVQAFRNFLPEISKQVERSISCPELNNTVVEATVERGAEWLDRASRESEGIEVRLKYSEDVHEVLAEFWRQYAQEPSRRTKLLEALAGRLVDVHLGGVLPKVKRTFQYGQFVEKVSFAKLFIIACLEDLNADDFATAKKFVRAECQRLIGLAAASARGRAPVESTSGVRAKTDDALTSIAAQLNTGEEDTPPEPIPKKRSSHKRSVDLEMSKDRIRMLTRIRAELKTVHQAAQRYTTTEQLKKDHPDFTLWKLLSAAEETSLLHEPFAVVHYSQVLVARHYGISPRTLKYDRQKLKRLGDLNSG